MVVRQAVQIGEEEHHQMAGVQVSEDPTQVPIQAHHNPGPKMERVEHDEPQHDPYAFDVDDGKTYWDDLFYHEIRKLIIVIKV